MTTVAQLAALMLTVVINGQPTQLEAFEHQGKAYVEAVAFVEAMGGSAAYDQANKKLIVVLPQGGAGAMGTEQMAGEWGVIGMPYTIHPNDPLNFTLNSAEFSVRRMHVGDTSVVPEGNEKLLVLHVTLQNPQAAERRVYWADLDLTAVDAMNVNREWSQELGMATTGESVDIDLKPAQKVDVYTAVVVPARGVVPKLMVISGENQVLRYDLRGQVVALPEPFADPDDPSGATALVKVPAESETWYPMGVFDVWIGGFGYPVAGAYDEPSEGKSYVLMELKLRNGGADEERLYADVFRGVLRTTEGRKIEWEYELLDADLESVDADLEPGEQMTVLMAFEAPVGARLTSFEIREGDDGRTYAYDFDGGTQTVRGASGASGSNLLDQIQDSPLGGLF